MKLKSSKLGEEIPLFIDTNLGTHLALAVPLDITAGDLKCKLVQEHLSCFANLGEIKVHALMVKRRSHFYHLPDAMPIKSAFQGFSGTWFLQMYASRLQDMQLPKPSIVKPTRVRSLGQGEPLKPIDSQKLSLKCAQHHKDHRRQLKENEPFMSSDNDVTECSQSEIIIALGDKNRGSVGNEKQPEVLPVLTRTKKSMRKKTSKHPKGKTAIADETHILELFSSLNPGKGKQIKGTTTMDNRNSRHLLSGHPFESREAPSMNVSKEISVTGIISRYFSDSDEVNSWIKQRGCELEETHTNEIVGSTMRTLECSVDQARLKRMVESDTETVCSINNVIMSDMKPFKASLPAKRGYRKRKKATGSEIRNKASSSRRIFPSPSSDKLQVGRKLIQAANSISISGSGRKLPKPLFMARCWNLSAPESSGLVRNLVFEINDLDD